MSFEQMCGYLGIRFTDSQRIAAKYLESRGQRFCAHFGIENCERLADELFERECAEITHARA